MTTARPLTFKFATAGRHINSETGVELVRFENETSRNWFVMVPRRGATPMRACTAAGTLAAARAAGKRIAAEVRQGIAKAYDAAAEIAAELLAEATATAAQPVKVTAAAPLVWRNRTDSTGRWGIERLREGNVLWFAPIEAKTGKRLGLQYPRFMDAKAAVQYHVEGLERAHITAAAMERARVAGDALWAQYDGQLIQAIHEDDLRTGEARRAARAAGGSGPRALSGWGRLAAAHRDGMRVS